MNGNLSIALLIVVVALALLARCDARHAMSQTGCVPPAKQVSGAANPADLPGPGSATSVDTAGHIREGGEHDPAPEDTPYRQRP